MTHIVMYSGGVGSFVAAKRVVEKHPGENVILLFADTLIEDPDVYRFMRDGAEHLGLEITVIKDGRDPWQLFHAENRMGGRQSDICSRMLKRELLNKWIYDRYGWSECVIHVGIDITEIHRYERMRERLDPYEVSAPLAEPPYMDKKDMLDYVKSLGLVPPRTYDMGFSHANCGGFCVKAGQAQFALLLKHFPERYAWHEAQEKNFRERTGKNVTIMRIGNKSVTLQEFREHVESGKEYDKTEFGGCGCAVS